AEAAKELQSERESIIAVREARKKMDSVVLEAYGFRPSDEEEMNSAFADRIPPASGKWRIYFGKDGADLDVPMFAHIVLSYCLGAALGRWDVRFATGDKRVPELPDPLASLPVCPPGQLQNENGLPITKEQVENLTAERRWNYPVEIPWDGILVDD